MMHTFATYQCLQKVAWDFFQFRLNLELSAKIENDLVSKNSREPGF